MESSPLIRDQTRAPALGARSLSCWTTRKSLELKILDMLQDSEGILFPSPVSELPHTPGGGSCLSHFGVCVRTHLFAVMRLSLSRQMTDCSVHWSAPHFTYCVLSTIGSCPPLHVSMLGASSFFPTAPSSLHDCAILSFIDGRAGDFQSFAAVNNLDRYFCT